MRAVLALPAGGRMRQVLRALRGEVCRALLLAAACLGCVPIPAAAAAQDELQPIPALTARVTDTTGTLDAQQSQALESELAALERRKGAQIGVLIVATTKPEDIAQYAIRVYDAWKLGRKGVDDGVLLVVAKDDHRVRIEVARGLEGAIPDAAAARIIRDYITPKFRSGDFYDGIRDATGALTKLVDGEALPPPSAKRSGEIGVVVFSLVFCAFSAFFLRMLLFFLPGPIRGLVVGIAIGGLQWWWLRTSDVTPGVSLLGASIGAGVAFLIGLAASSQKRGRYAAAGGAAGAGGSFGLADSGSSFSSGSSDSGSSSSSDFSGGGGESGGGGSSGDW